MPFFTVFICGVLHTHVRGEPHTHKIATVYVIVLSCCCYSQEVYTRTLTSSLFHSCRSEIRLSFNLDTTAKNSDCTALRRRSASSLFSPTNTVLPPPLLLSDITVCLRLIVASAAPATEALTAAAASASACPIPATCSACCVCRRSCRRSEPTVSDSDAGESLPLPRIPPALPKDCTDRGEPRGVEETDAAATTSSASCDIRRECRNAGGTEAGREGAAAAAASVVLVLLRWIWPGHRVS